MALKNKVFSLAVNTAITNRIFRNIASQKLDRYLHKTFLTAKSNALPSMLEKRYQFVSAMLHGIKNNLDKGHISPATMKKMLSVFIGENLKTDRIEKKNDAREIYFQKYGEYPPAFCVLSPTQACNLNCHGCYAVSDETANHRLSYETVRQVVRDVHDIFGSRFMTISGGEPFIYKDSGKTLLDLFEEFNDMFFLIYTNGTLITKEVAQRLAQLGNVTPAISVEGYRHQTDERRGTGVHSQVVDAMANLREAGVPFGISVTATKKNVNILLDDYFYDYFFGQLGATYMWQFQMMPVGRGKELLDLMITPRQRVELYHMWEKLIEQKRYCVADFWNSGALTEGCLAYGRWGGYFYINWDGKIMPCVFVPFYQDNVNDLYAEGKTLADGLHSKLMKNGRKWQHQYGFENGHHRENILMPCSIKDNFDNFRKNILPDEAIPENPEAEIIRTDEEYYRFLTEYDRELSHLTEEIWRKTYLT
ncbi:radical SAM/SPASM domain-containing protein [Prolixibacter sp. NT017]|uniref:radical SAM/SPASM domain-containing protein n=1 Tax=Prolixibacter sp. NT017 TaxID=2652390 RepID=UPI0012893893|nr:radical SAM/SPASM domain-containing protein [Prolixibacter sp. NT017]GET25911.1 hypothetical protein NT017_22400 [Prolixibacter sp. NT017]